MISPWREFVDRLEAYRTKRNSPQIRVGAMRTPASSPRAVVLCPAWSEGVAVFDLAELQF